MDGFRLKSAALPGKIKTQILLWQPNDHVPISRQPYELGAVVLTLESDVGRLSDACSAKVDTVGGLPKHIGESRARFISSGR